MFTSKAQRNARAVFWRRWIVLMFAGWLPPFLNSRIPLIVAPRVGLPLLAMILRAVPGRGRMRSPRPEPPGGAA